MLIIHHDSHVDHVSPGILEYLKERYRDHPGGAILIETLPVPAEFTGSFTCDLYGPAVGDPPVPEAEVHYRVRPGRKGASRTVDRPRRPAHQLTVVAGPYDDQPLVLFTCYGGPRAPREIWDCVGDETAMRESLLFWHRHALAFRETH